MRKNVFDILEGNIEYIEDNIRPYQADYSEERQRLSGIKSDIFVCRTEGILEPWQFARLIKKIDGIVQFTHEEEKSLKKIEFGVSSEYVLGRWERVVYRFRTVDGAREWLSAKEDDFRELMSEEAAIRLAGRKAVEKSLEFPAREDLP